ncbi:MAG TPA: dihydroneopterin aldolase [Elusimicrobiota bacterium]|nr:dihydroneopterin aldolase [Elusimicrobiota bacterium]
MDKIIIQDMVVRMRVGCTPQERSRVQPIHIDVEARCRSLRRAGVKDDLSCTVDYAALALKIRFALGKMSCRTIERVAERVSQLVLETSRVRSVTVRVRKKVLPGIAWTAVEIDRMG